MNLERLGIADRKIKQFESKGIECVDDLIKYFPRRYLDFTKPVTLKEAEHGQTIAVVAQCKNILRTPTFTKITMTDSNNEEFYLTWFQNDFGSQHIVQGQTYFVAGRYTVDEKYGRSIPVPMICSRDIEGNKKLFPVYSKIKGMADTFLTGSIEGALAVIMKQDYLEPLVANDFGLITQFKAYQEMHKPSSLDMLEAARKRMVFDELFMFALQMKSRELNKTQKSNYKLINSTWIQKFIDTLPFEPTQDQLNAVMDAYDVLKSGEKLQALVQGDVGAGKTIVAMLYLLLAVENGYQGALMAPTNVLARQHYEEIKERFAPLGIEVGFINGDMKVREKKAVLKQVADGSVQILVGTHAIFSKDVVFKDLALFVVDEEHRFGVKQRESLGERTEGVHTISMSATPIPRTLALTIHGNATRVYQIKALPKGRKPIKTVANTNEYQVYDGIERQIKEGRQAYVICPLVEETDYEGLAGIESVDETYDKMVKYFAGKNIKVGKISGKMKQVDIDAEIAKFSNKVYDVLISTTIVEVGVNVPNATVILIKHANRFGLAQLHQLRGRVGRGSHESFCVLHVKDKENLKIKAMLETTDGFKIAEKDLELRGTGSLMGDKQSGKNLVLEKILDNTDMYNKITQLIDDISSDEKRLKFYRSVLKSKLNELGYKKAFNEKEEE